MTLWRVEGKDMRTGEDVDVQMDAQSAGDARSKAVAAGIWVARVFDDSLEPVPMAGPPGRPGVRLYRPPSASPAPRLVVRVVQHGTLSEQLNLIFTIAAGIALGFWLTLISVWIVGVGLLAGALGSGRHSTPPPFSTPSGSTQQNP